MVTPALFASTRHEPLVSEAWDEPQVRRCIEEIVACAIDAYSPDELYPPHPLDEMLTATSAGTSPYFGAMGVFWGIAYLSAAGVIDDHRDWVRQRLDAMIHANAGSSFAEGSLLMGPLPALALRARLQPHTSATVDRDVIHAALARAADGSVQELMWGIPGGAMLAEQLLRETGEPRWQALLRKQLDAIWRARVDVPGIGLMWNEELYGSRNLYLGAVHGFAGQVMPLLRAFTLLSAEARSAAGSAIARTLDVTAVRDGTLVNWPTLAAADAPACLVQYCHGAPGVIACVADASPDVLPGVDDLLLGGGELIWRAGPLAKGSNLCHGTAGNGVAFLKLFSRTGDEVWLERARAFGMHAIRQYRHAKGRYGRDRFSLFTGDIGVAAFLRGCIDKVAAMPLVDAL